MDQQKRLDQCGGRHGYGLLHLPILGLQRFEGRDVTVSATRAMHARMWPRFCSAEAPCLCSNLGSNGLSGTIPPSLGNLTGLTYLCVPCDTHTRAATAQG